MKFIGFILAASIGIGILIGIGYGVMELWELLSYQWSILGSELRPAVLLLSSVMFFCALLMIILINSSVRKSLNFSQGRSNAYQDYLNWYSDQLATGFSEVDLDYLKTIRNKFILWAARTVIKQFNKLYEELTSQDHNSDNVRKYATFTYIEIQRSLGRRGNDKLRQI